MSEETKRGHIWKKKKVALSKLSACDSRQISLKILEQEMNSIFETFPNIFDQTFGQNNWF
jgi:hypothetical protein